MTGDLGPGLFNLRIEHLADVMTALVGHGPPRLEAILQDEATQSLSLLRVKTAIPMPFGTNSVLSGSVK
jgi:hypothetical protein